MYASDTAFLVLLSLLNDGDATADDLAERVKVQTLNHIANTLKANEAGGYVVCDENGIWSLTQAGRDYIDSDVEQRR